MDTFVTPEVREIALSLMEELDCPRAVTVAMLLRHGEWVQLVNLECTPSAYCDSESYFRAVRATDFLRKLDSPIDGIDLESLAYEKWLWAEKQCFLTNRKLNDIMDFGTLHGAPVPDAMLEFIRQLRKNVLWLIGEGPDSVYDGKFGPGATVSDISGRTSVLHKMSSTPTLTSSALYYLVPWTGTKWAAACAARRDEAKIVRGNAYFTVPKSATARRSCAKEPSLNGYYQLGLGLQLRRRLKGRGIDLENGQDVHRRVACVASKTGEFCTIDLSSASDTLCTALVRLCIPHGWFNHLNDLRSPYTQVNGRWHKLEKFSSMGNGYTFELETTVFTALCMTIMGPLSLPGKNLWVYGDDIIVPSVSGPDVITTLKFFGFTPNERKTFLTGSFRESCGGDYYDGVAVRPHYLKEIPNEPQEYIALANGLRRMGRSNDPSGRSQFLLIRTWFKCLDFIPSTIRSCRGPEGLGDLVIHDDQSRWKIRWRASNIRYVRVYRPASFKGTAFCRFDPDVQIAGALYGVMLYPRKPRPGWHEGYDARMLISREGVSGYKVGWVPYS